MFRFRFPIALLHYLKEDTSSFGSTSEKSRSNSVAYQNAIEKAREFAVPEGKEKRVRPTLSEAEAYLQEIVKADREAQEAKKDDRSR